MAAPVHTNAPTTRKLPLTTDGEICISVSHDRAATVVSLEGIVATNACDLIVQTVAPPPGAEDVTIVDLNNVTLVDRYTFHRLLSKLCPPGAKVRLVCRRSTARHLLRAWHLHERFDIFATMDMALHPIEVGTGWRSQRG